MNSNGPSIEPSGTASVNSFLLHFLTVQIDENTTQQLWSLNKYIRFTILNSTGPSIQP